MNADKKTLLLVEDEALIVLSKKMELEKYGYIVLAVSTGEAAVALSKENDQIELILMDIDLGPGIDGTEAAEQILNDRNIPVVFMSSHTEPEIVEKTERITSYGYVVKSSSITVLDASIKMAFKLFNADKKIIEGRDLLQKTVDSVNDPILLIDKDYRVLMSNKAVKENYDYDKEFCYQISHGSNTPCSTTPEHPCVLREVFKTKQAMQTLHIHTNKKGQKRSVELIATPLFENNRMVGVIETSHDVTEEIETARLLKESEQRYEEVVSNIPNIIWSAYLADSGLLTDSYISDVVDDILKLPKGTINSSMDKFNSHVFPDHFKQIRSAIHEASQNLGVPVEVEYQMIKGNAELIWVSTTGVCSEGGDRLKFFGTTRDISDKKKSEKEINNLNNKNKAIIESIPDIIMEVDENKVYTWANEAGYSFFGDDVIGKEASSYFEGEQDIYDLVSPIFKGSEDVIYVESWQCRKDGRKRLLAWWCKVLKDIDGTVTGTISTARDITEQKQAKELLEESEKRYRELYEHSPLGYQSLDSEGCFIEANPVLCSLLGYAHDEIIGRWFGDFLTPEGIEIFKANFPKFKSRGEIYSVPFDMIPQNRKIFSVEIDGSIGYDMSGNFKQTHCVIHDVSSRKKMEKERLRNNYLLLKSQEMGNIGTWELDIKQNNLKWTDEIYKIFNIPLGTEMTFELFMECIHPADRAYVKEKWSKDLNNESFDMEYRIIVNEKIKWIREKADINFDLKGKPVSGIGFAQDITRQKTMENEIKYQLSEKEIILKEVHHRIKNNFASIEHLLFLQAQSTDNTEVQSSLQDAIGRVSSMRVLYEKLLLTDNYQVTSVLEYLTNLIDQIMDMFPENIDITVEKHIDDLLLNAKQLVPVGIIVNELLTNSNKYAFTGRASGAVEIILKQNKENISLTVQDNGIGLPEGFDIDNQKGFGLMLVKMLSEQLDGSFTIKSNNGSLSTLEFQI